MEQLNLCVVIEILVLFISKVNLLVQCNGIFENNL